MEMHYMCLKLYRAIQKSFYQVSHDIIIITPSNKKKSEIKNIKRYGQTNTTYFQFSFKYAPNILQLNGIRFHCHDPLDRKTFGSYCIIVCIVMILILTYSMYSYLEEQLRWKLCQNLQFNAHLILLINFCFMFFFLIQLTQYVL
jgi:hypothetical protein